MSNSDSPLVIRNKMPLIQRGFVMLWCLSVVVMTWTLLASPPLDPDGWLRWIVLIFWAGAVFVARWAFTVEAGDLLISAPANLEVTRGPAFKRQKHRIGRAVLAIDESEDSDGDPYFKLMIEAPGGPLVIAEAHRVDSLESLKLRIERAASGRG